MTKRKEMLTFYYIVGFAIVLALCVRIIFIIFNPLGLWLRWFQIIPCLLYAAYAFMYFKLYMDTVPIISLLTTTLVHGVISYVFTKTVAWKALLVLVCVDVLYIGMCACKAAWFPFVTDKDDEEEDLFDDLIE